MVQFSLPQNSKILKGKFYKDKTGSNNLKKVNVYRWSPASNENPRIDTFEVDLNECGPIVLDIGVGAGESTIAHAIYHP